MTRLRADLYLLIATIIWGFAFVGQKAAMDHMGPFGFNGIRFILSLLVVLPFLINETKKHPPLSGRDFVMIFPVCLAFMGGVFFQQIGVMTTSVTNAGFITGLYVVFTPFIAWMVFRHRPSNLIWPACILTLLGMWTINGGSFTALTQGDLWTVLCALSYAVQIALLGWYVSKTKRPFFAVSMQYAATVLVGCAVGFTFETVTVEALYDNIWSLLYTGVISGGIAYTLQGVAQQYTPPSDGAIIMSAEALFAAVGGALFLAETFDGAKIAGCALILLAILTVEGRAFFKGRSTDVLT